MVIDWVPHIAGALAVLTTVLSLRRKDREVRRLSIAGIVLLMVGMIPQVRIGRLRRAAALSLVFGLTLVGLAHGAIAFGGRDLHRTPKFRSFSAESSLRRAGQLVASPATFQHLRNTPLYGYAPIAKAIDWADQTLYPAFMGLY